MAFAGAFGGRRLAGRLCVLAGGSLAVQRCAAPPAPGEPGRPGLRSGGRGLGARPARCAEARTPAVHVTGFGPFGGIAENPTSVICGVLREYLKEGVAPEGVSPALLEEFSSAGIAVQGLDALEVSAEACRAAVPAIVRGLMSRGSGPEGSGPAAIVHLGVSSSSKTINLECRGVNEADFRIPDALGCQPQGEPVVPGAEPLLYTSLRLPELLGELRDRGVACEISTDPGRYICNYIFFTSLHATKSTGIPALFVHVPSFEAVSRPAQVTAVLLLLLAVARQLRASPTSPAVARTGKALG